MSKLTNSQIGHFNQVDWSKNTHVIQAPSFCSKCMCSLVKKDQLVNLDHLKNQ